MRKFLSVLGLSALISCQDKVICPAFQSTYILNDSTRNAYYSYVWQLDEIMRLQYLSKGPNTEGNDSLGIVAQPKVDDYAYAGEKVVPWRVRGRTKYGIVKYEPYWLKKYRMKTAPMENVFSPEPIEPNFVASNFADSLKVDSLAITSVDSTKTQIASLNTEKEEPKYLFKYDPKDNFNVEQEYYNKYYGEKLIDKRPNPELLVADSLSGKKMTDSLQTKKEPFFKELFKKKKNQTDTASISGDPAVSTDGDW